MTRTLLAAACGLVAAPAFAADAERFFEAKVRPVLVEYCQSCHGPRKQMAGLRLDGGPAVLEGGESGPAVKPGDPEASLLVKAVRQTGDLKMPPKGKLPPEAIDALAAWVKMGAPWPADAVVKPDAGKDHWAFRPVADPSPPAVKDEAWPRTSVDRFVLAKLEAKGLAPTPPADKRTLIRRITFDLLGLPPTPEEIDAFLKDESPDAYEKVVGRLLTSPHYGERWGRHWLDVARYADTKGYVFFEEAEFPWAWTYRDYVIRAFNDDLPYDRFILEQLAADRLPLGADKRPLTALGFLTVGGRFMNNPHDIFDDRIDVATRGLLGLTVSCARCHDHKFDPIPSRDYYSLYGVFASSAEPAVPPLFAQPPKTDEYARFDLQLQALELKLAEFVAAKRAEVITGARTRAAEYLLAAHAQRDKPSTEEFMLIADGADLNPAMITRWQAFLARTRKRHHPAFAPWHALADLPEQGFADKARETILALAAANDPDRPVNPLVLGALAANPPKTLADAAKAYGGLLAVADKIKQPSDSSWEELRRVLYGPDAPPDVPPGQLNELALLPDRPSQAKLQELRKAVEKWRATGAGAPPRAMALADLPTPYEPRVFLRGNPNNPGQPVPRQFLGALSGDARKPFADGSGRLELAHAIADRRNPLTARVMVNRVWHWHFGKGIVATPSDFGTRGEPPTHPELLDHLATAFMNYGWSVKKLHRRIVLSATYRQGPAPERRQRLDFESLRDALLAVSGRLDRTVGGPPVKDLLGTAANRRTVYGFIDRQQLPGLLRTFDFPSPDATNPQRDATTVPQQALFLMNHPFVHDCARRLAQRPDVAGEKDPAKRVARMYEHAYGRPPKPGELAVAREYLGDGNTAVLWERYAQALLVANEFAFVD